MTTLDPRPVAQPMRTAQRAADGSWTWTLPGGAGAGTPAGVHPVADSPAEHALRFLLPEDAPRDAGDHTGTAHTYRGVRGDRSVADAIRVAPLSPDMPAALSRVVARAVAERPRPAHRLGSAGESLWDGVGSFLRLCEQHRVPGAVDVRAALAAALRGHDAVHARPEAVLGLGRIVWGWACAPGQGHEGQGHEGQAHAADVLVPPGHACWQVDAARVLAELYLTVMLFEAAGKPSAASTGAVLNGVVGELAGRCGTWPEEFPALVGLLVADHARRLATYRGLDPATAAVELALALEVMKGEQSAQFERPPQRPLRRKA
jgi:hypothetical protein